MASNERALLATTQTLVADGKCLLAMDESNPTRNKRFAAHGIPQTEEMRRACREMIVTTPHLGDDISDAILYDETIRQPMDVRLSWFLPKQASSPASRWTWEKRTWQVIRERRSTKGLMVCVSDWRSI